MLNNIIKVLISNIVTMITSFINTLVIPKLLTINGYAQYQTFMLYVSYIGLLTLGFHAGLFVKYGGKNKENIDRAQYKSEIRIIIWSQILISLLVIFVAIILKETLLLCASICILTINFVTVYKYLYQAWDMFTYFSLINIIQSLGFSLSVIVVALIKGNLHSRDIIGLYIGMNLICFIPVFISYVRDVHAVKSKPMLSADNLGTFKIGFLLILGSGANVIFHSIDKFFIKGLYSTYNFSMYCFGITLLNVMNVFISAISQPMYLRLVSNTNNTKELSFFKEVLISFGALSGCAYYAVAIIIDYFLPEYRNSLEIVSILFSIFPAAAIIDCLYVNLYKVTDQIRKYLIALIIIIVCAVVFNIIGVYIYDSYIVIAIATSICYYVWLLYSSKDFSDFMITRRDIVFLIGFLIVFVGLTRISNYFIGFIVYLFVILIWELIVYKNTFIELFKKIKK